MVAKFQQTGSFGVKQARRKKPVLAEEAEDVTKALQEQSNSDS